MKEIKRQGREKKEWRKGWRRESSTIGFCVMVDSLKYREREKKFLFGKSKFSFFL